MTGKALDLDAVLADRSTRIIVCCGAGLNAMTSVLTKVLGAHVLKDLQAFIAALDTMFGGFRERADATYQLLQARGTSFVVVAAPERDALREASYFVERLGEERMPLSGLVLNRVHTSGATGLSADRAAAGAETLAEARTHPLAAGILRLHAERMRLIEREQSLRGRFTAAHPRVPVVDVPAQPGDVHDLDGLRLVGESLAGG